MFTSPVLAASLRPIKQLAAADQADLRSAGTAGDGSRRTRHRVRAPISTLRTADEATAFVSARIAEGSDYIKVIVDDGAPSASRGPR